MSRKQRHELEGKRRFQQCLVDAQRAFQSGSYFTAVQRLQDFPLSYVRQHAETLTREERASFRNQYGLALKRAGLLRRSLVQYQRALEEVDNDIVYHNNISIVLWELRDLNNAFARLEHAIMGSPPRTQIDYLVSRSTFDIEVDPVRAAQTLRTCWAYYAKHDPDGIGMANALEKCGVLLGAASGHLQESIELLTEALARVTRLYGSSSHPRVGDTSFYLAHSLNTNGQLGEALSCVERALDLYRGRHAARSAYVARAESLKGHILSRQGRFEQARVCLDDAERIFRASYNDLAHPDWGKLALYRGELCVRSTGNYRSALEFFVKARSIMEHSLPGTIALAEAINDQGYCELHQSDRSKAAMAHFVQSHKLLKKHPLHPFLRDLYVNIRDTCLQMNPRRSGLVDCLNMRILASQARTERGNSMDATDDAARKGQPRVSGIEFLIVAAPGKHQAIVRPLEKRIAAARCFYRNEGFVVKHQVLSSLAELAVQIEENKRVDQRIAVVFVDKQGSESAATPLTQEQCDRMPMLVDYRHLSWLEMSIVVLRSECDLTTVYCEDVRTVAGRLKSETSRTASPLCFKGINTQTVSDVNRLITQAFESYVASSTSS